MLIMTLASGHPIGRLIRLGGHWYAIVSMLKRINDQTALFAVCEVPNA